MSVEVMVGDGDFDERAIGDDVGVGGGTVDGWVHDLICWSCESSVESWDLLWSEGLAVEVGSLLRIGVATKVGKELNTGRLC